MKRPVTNQVLSLQRPAARLRLHEELLQVAVVSLVARRRMIQTSSWSLHRPPAAAAHRARQRLVAASLVARRRVTLAGAHPRRPARGQGRKFQRRPKAGRHLDEIPSSMPAAMRRKRDLLQDLSLGLSLQQAAVGALPRRPVNDARPRQESALRMARPKRLLCRRRLSQQACWFRQKRREPEPG